MAEASISAQRLLAHIRGFRAMGGQLPDERLMAAVGITEAQLEHSDQRFPVRLITLAAEAAAAMLGDPVLGLSLAGNITRAERSFLLEMARNAATLAEYVALLSRYTCLHTEIATFEIEHLEGDISAIVFHSPVEDQLSRHQIDGGLCIMAEVIELYAGARPLWVELRHFPPAGYAARYTEKLGCEVRFGASRHAAIVSTGMMFQRREADEEKRYLAHYERRRDALREDTLAGKVAFMIRKALVHGEPVREAIAAELCMSVRTLQRSLASENTTFKQVLESTRTDLARFYLLHSPFTVAQVSLLLGYSESSQFYQAFRRWFGCSPGALRAQASGNPRE